MIDSDCFFAAKQNFYKTLEIDTFQVDFRNGQDEAAEINCGIYMGTIPKGFQPQDATTNSLS